MHDFYKGYLVGVGIFYTMFGSVVFFENRAFAIMYMYIQVVCHLIPFKNWQTEWYSQNVTVFFVYYHIDETLPDLSMIINKYSLHWNNLNILKVYILKKF